MDEATETKVLNIVLSEYVQLINGHVCLSSPPEHSTRAFHQSSLLMCGVARFKPCLTCYTVPPTSITSWCNHQDLNVDFRYNLVP